MIDIDAIIDSMGWSLDPSECADMRRLCQATLKAATEQSGEPVAWVNHANLISAEIERQRGGAGDCHTWSEQKTDYHNTPLYTRPQPAPAVPEAVQLVCDALIAIAAHSGNPKGMAEMLKPWRARAEEFTRNYGRQQPAPAVPEEVYSKTPGCKQCDEAEACGLTFCPECDALLAAAPETGKESLQVQAVPGISDAVIDDLRQAFANAARWGGHEACHQVDVRALLAGKSPN
ncbi:hypothetical protein KIF53_15210 [Chromobacterium subtsugae]|uniref:Uncharacterized protein n=1 Tax=Chromobacterium subtsugae TaxID=251747 RepID=A0ABS7FFY3_9NEIS|nr:MULTISPECIES: hypothetical protein [Chromobacterium]KUM02802.1 hypothetical protein Cv017_01755 [Chromobacterium subtsugae]KZE85018.1 hypothetical protein AWB61_03300 [Chromobacterium sp. F49]MBW7567754.1 hypothetical protein [Chromobacterium subtsugae]MBW8288980.1 hypothetical protein [Chromobacterium subtsugae]WSE89548.1 hypothetical protein U6115_11685 [Chromobacterium subtsugae]